MAHACDAIHAAPAGETEAELLGYLRTGCRAGSIGACRALDWRLASSGDSGKKRYVTGLQDDCLSGAAKSCEEAAKWLDIWKTPVGMRDSFEDIDQVIENHFTFAEFLSRG